METDDTGEGNGNEIQTFSLLTLADLAVALQDQVDDHTYARNCDLPQLLDQQCLSVKEKDHNYSTCSRTELRGRAKHNLKKSSSEENLASSCSSEMTKFTFDDSSLTWKKSHSCEKVVTSDQDVSNTLFLYVSESAPKKKSCSSWPKENTFKEQMKERTLEENIYQNEVLGLPIYDHTYAREKSFFCIQKEHNYDIRQKFSFNDPKKIGLKKSKQNGNYSLSFPKLQEQSLSDIMKNSPLVFEHNYTYRNVQCHHGHQASGSVESLEMDLSESETDSCEETEKEENKLVYTQMMNTQQDHPYSKSGILSF